MSRERAFALKILAGLLISALIFTVFDGSIIPRMTLLSALWLCVFFTEESPLILIVGSFFSFFSGHGLNIDRFYFTHIDMPEFWIFTNASHVFERPFQRTLVYLVCAALIVVASWICLNNARAQKHAMGLSLGFLVFLMLMFDRFRTEAYSGYLIFVLLCFWVKMFWSIILIGRIGLAKPSLPLKQMWMAFPLWSFGSVPQWIPLRVDRLKNGFVNRANETRLSVLSIAAVCLLIVGGLHLRIGYAFTNLGVRDPFHFGSLAFLETVPGVATAWALILLQFADIVLFAFGAYLTVGSLLLMTAGIPAVTPLISPHLATSFHDFSGRILRFYIQLVTDVFYAPVVSSLRFMRAYPKSRTFLATTFSVLIVGVLHHFLHYLLAIAELGLWPTLLAFFSNQFVYLFIIAIACGSSVIWVRSGHLERSRWRHVLRFFLIVTIYAVIHTLVYNGNSDLWVDRLRLYEFLFTGHRL